MGAMRMRRTWTKMGVTLATLVAVVATSLALLSGPAAALPSPYVAVQSGNWYEPDTWVDGLVPRMLGNSDRVYIPTGIAVTIPSINSVHATTSEIRVGGFLFIAGDLVVGRLIVGSTGEVYNQGGLVRGGLELSSEGKLVNNGRLETPILTTNGELGVFRNFGELVLEENQFAAGFHNWGQFENAGTVIAEAIRDWDADFFNHFGGTVLNQAEGHFDTAGTGFVNVGVFDNYGTLSNTGSFDNSDELAELRLRCGSSFIGNPLIGNPPRNWCDSQAPIVEVPGAITQEATGPGGALVDFTVVAKDNIDPAPVIDCTPADRSVFPLGATTVTCTGTDYVGNSSSGSFPVTIVDTTVPDLTVNGDTSALVVQHNEYLDAGASAADVVSGDLSGVVEVTGTVDVDVPGNYTLTYSVVDGSGNTATATRTVTVITGAQASDDLIVDIRSFGLRRSTTEDLLRPALQISQILHDSNQSNDRSACTLLDAFAASVTRVEQKGTLTPAQADLLLGEAAAIGISIGC